LPLAAATFLPSIAHHSVLIVIIPPPRDNTLNPCPL
jgi:hypothetical protein